MAELRERRFYMGADRLRNGVEWRRKAKAMQSIVKSSEGKALHRNERLGRGMAVKRLVKQRHRMVKRGEGTVVICTGKAWSRSA